MCLYIFGSIQSDQKYLFLALAKIWSHRWRAAGRNIRCCCAANYSQKNSKNKGYHFITFSKTKYSFIIIIVGAAPFIILISCFKSSFFVWKRSEIGESFFPQLKRIPQMMERFLLRAKTFSFFFFKKWNDISSITFLFNPWAF